MTTTLFRNGTIRRLPGKAVAEWLLVEDSMVTAVGTGERPQGDRVIDLDGGTLVPAFRDAHVHLPATGLYATGLDFRGERRTRAIVEALAERAVHSDAVLFGGNFEDPLDRPLTRFELDEAAGARPALVARADMHSCVVSSALLEQLELTELDGVDVDEHGVPTGYLRERAAAQAWTWFDRNMTAQEQRDLVRAAISLAYSKGIAEVHEMFVVEWRGWDSAEAFLDAVADVALEVSLWLATPDVERVVDMGLPRIGGDFFLDGSFGSHTAWLNEPYATHPPAGTPANGIPYRSDEELLDFFTRAQQAGLQAGVHAIGDAAIDQAIRTWEKVAADCGETEVRDLGHRIEHFECASDDHIARARRLGLRASVQPTFDRYWGGPDGLYSNRIGWNRARDMNRFSTMLKAGLVLAAGSDSTVTPLDPFLQMAALREHHRDDERMSALEALRLHTMAPAVLARHHATRSTLEPGMLADLALLDRDPLSVSPGELVDTVVLGTWVAGHRVWPEDEAETA
ncbi:MAG: amidohydrolase family protein [Actinomycetota bacterium]|nr:amidohydrolase family protein [Actinomycetota bacterium]